MAPNIMAPSPAIRPVATGFEARATAIMAHLGRFPLGVHQLLFRIQLFVYPDAWSEHLVWASILLFLLTRGPGAVSLDRAIGIERGN